MKLKDIAALAGVSVTTASYVVNGAARERRIHPDTAARVLAVAAQHDWRPDASAAALRRGHTRTIGFIVPDIENPSYARLAKLLDASARTYGYQLMVTSSEDDAANERDIVANLRARRCDGLIVASCLAQDDALYRDCQHAGLPVVAVDRQLDPRYFSSFVSDDESACEVLTQVLLAPTPVDVVYLGARAELAVSRARRKGFVSAMRRSGATGTVRHARAFAREDGRREMARILRAGTALPAAILTTSYVLLTGVLDALSVYDPDWAASTRLATFGDSQLLDYLPVQIDTVSQQHDQLARGALATLLRSVAGETVAPGVHNVPRQLRQRRGD